MRFVSIKLAIAMVLMMAMTGCVSTAPGLHPAQYGQSSLKVCAGTKVSNAPRKNEHGFIRSYQPIQSIRGVSLLTAPVQSCLSSGFGRRRGGAGRTHKGIDLYTQKEREVFAAGTGKVIFVGRQSGYGRLIIIDHGSKVETRYAHLSSFSNNIKVGTKVRQGTPLGKTGKTGNATAIHLHYEILVDGKQRDPLVN